MINYLILVLGVVICLIVFRETYIRYMRLRQKRRIINRKYKSEIKLHNNARLCARRYKNFEELQKYVDIARRHQYIAVSYKKKLDKLDTNMTHKTIIMGLCITNCVLCIMYFI